MDFQHYSLVVWMRGKKEKKNKNNFQCGNFQKCHILAQVLTTNDNKQNNIKDIKKDALRKVVNFFQVYVLIKEFFSYSFFFFGFFISKIILLVLGVFAKFTNKNQ